MTHRDRAGDASGQWAGRRGAAGDAGHRQGFPTPAQSPAAGSPARPEAASPSLVGQGFRTAQCLWTGPAARDAPHRRATRCWPKTPTWKHGGSRLYESLSARFGINGGAGMITAVGRLADMRVRFVLSARRISNRGTTKPLFRILRDRRPANGHRITPPRRVPRPARGSCRR